MSASILHWIDDGIIIITIKTQDKALYLYFCRATGRGTDEEDGLESHGHGGELQGNEFGNDTWRAFAVKGSMVVHTGKVTTE